MNKKIIILLLSIQLFSLSINCQEDKTMEWKATISGGEIKYIPNVSYLGQGYNIFYGNPQSTDGLDPGYRNIPIVDLEYQDNLWDSVTADRTYYVPDGVRLTTEKSCLISFSSKEVTSLKQYQDNLSAQVSGNGDFFAGQFSASVDFQLMKSQLSQSDTQCIQSQATCSVFHLSFFNNLTSLPKLSPQIIDKIQYLYSQKDNVNQYELYYDFFEQYGTHVASEVQLGSIFGYKFLMKSSEVQNQSSLGLDVTASASLYGVSGKVKTQYEQTQLNNFKSAMKSWSSYSIGAIPAEDQDAVKWAMQTLDRPMPIKTQLTTIYSFLNQYKNYQDMTGLSSDALTYVTDYMKLYSRSYCEKRLEFDQKLGSCIGYVQKTSNSFTGIKRIQNIKSSKTIQVNSDLNSQATQQPDSSTNKNQIFEISRPTNNENLYQIKLDAKSNCLGVASINDGQPLILTTCNTDKMTLFEIVDIGQGFQYIKIVDAEYYLTVESTSSLSDTSDNARITLTSNKSTCKGCTFFKFI